MFDVDRQKYSRGTQFLLWDVLRWLRRHCFVLSDQPTLAFHLGCQLTRLYSPIIRVLVIACKCPGAVETDKRYIKRECGILFINFVLIGRQVFCRITEKTAKATSRVCITPKAAAIIIGLGSECYTVFKVIKRSEKCDLHNVIHHRCCVMNLVIAHYGVSVLLFFLSLFASSTWQFSLSFFVVYVLKSVLSKLAFTLLPVNE